MKEKAIESYITVRPYGVEGWQVVNIGSEETVIATVGTCPEAEKIAQEVRLSWNRELRLPGRYERKVVNG